VSRSRSGPVTSYILNSHWALSERPALAARIGIIVATWAQIDHGLNLLVTDIAWADADLAADLLGSLYSDKPRSKVIETFARRRLPPELAGRFLDAVRRLRNGARNRNDIAHGLWGLSPDRPDELIWVCHKTSLAHRGQIGEPGRTYTQEELAVFFSSSPEPEVYDRRRFDQIENAALRLGRELDLLRLEVLNLRRASLPVDP
jgi:hypothetical protein